MFDLGAPPPDPWSRAADILDPPDQRSEWYLPNPKDAIRGRARASQRPPTVEDWFVWLIMTGRGWGKTRTAAEFIDSQARLGKPGDQILVAGRTPSDVRDYALNGEGGLLRHHPDIQYVPSSRLLIWPNGVEGLIRSGANPEEFRGFSGELAWLDEFAAWDYPSQCWENVIFGMRERDPRIVITSTPRPIPKLKEIVKAPGTVVTRGSSRENRENLSAKWVHTVLDPLVGTRLGRQEIDGELLEDVEGALWNLAQIDALRVRRESVPPLKRIAVGVDPQGVKAVGSMTGIVAVGIGVDGHLYVLVDNSINGSPAEWGAKAVATFDQFVADRIVGERNYGGDMVESTIRTVRANVSFEPVVATRGKIVRAEPVSSMYEQGKAHHVGAFTALEDEMCSFKPGEPSPNRMDAMVWAATLLLGAKPEYTEATWGREIASDRQDGGGR